MQWQNQIESRWPKLETRLKYTTIGAVIFESLLIGVWLVVHYYAK